MTSLIIVPGEKLEQAIAIQTRKGSNISNNQDHDLPLPYRRTVEDLNKRYRDQCVRFVNDASPIYNCHGLTFGSRRAIIWKAQDIMTILKEDDYVEVDKNDVREGDVIIYFDDDGEPQHSGLVIGKKENMPLVYSKWGLGREAVHLFSQCPYNPSSVKYYRISK